MFIRIGIIRESFEFCLKYGRRFQNEYISDLFFTDRDNQSGR